jgi:heme exporter protein CcmD
MDDHNFGFVIAAYGLGLLITLAMIGAVLLDYRQLKKALARFKPRAEDGTGNVRD